MSHYLLPFFLVGVTLFCRSRCRALASPSGARAPWDQIPKLAGTAPATGIALSQSGPLSLSLSLYIYIYICIYIYIYVENSPKPSIYMPRKPSNTISVQFLTITVDPIIKFRVDPYSRHRSLNNVYVEGSYITFLKDRQVHLQIQISWPETLDPQRVDPKSVARDSRPPEPRE